MKKIVMSILAITSLSQISFGQTWLTTGNTLINPSTDYLGTNAAQPLVLKTNAVDRLKIEDDGDFQFGGGYTMTNPIYSFTGLEREILTITNYTQLHSFPNFPAPYDLFKIQNYNIQSAVIYPNVPTPTNLFKIDYRGYVGVGLETPVEKFHLHNGMIRVSGTNSSGGPMIVLGGTATSAWGDWGMEYGVSTSVPSMKGLNFWKPSGSNNPGNYYLFIADNGNVGIGTDNPGSFKLAVEGKIGAREILVTTASPWPDYVFEDGYKKAELEEIEKYIREHKHLPGIDSAEEIKKNGGIDLGAMQLKQMEKIEELYLYMIDLKKENQELKAMIVELQK